MDGGTPETCAGGFRFRVHSDKPGREGTGMEGGAATHLLQEQVEEEGRIEGAAVGLRVEL